MKYLSSRNSGYEIKPAQALIKGLSEDGGLFTPILGKEKLDINQLTGLDYRELAAEVIAFFFDDFTKDELKECIRKAYDVKFDIPEIVKLKETKQASILELWHGPTSAFKDLALTMLPHLLNTAYKKINCNKTLAILTATSGDTGKAALASFADVDNTAIIVFYPEIGVSPIQKLQMATSKGNNVDVIALKGNFDDCQKLVKKVTTDQEFLSTLDRLVISSANSINVGRLIPQIVYYYYTYLKLIEAGKITPGTPINFCVPTGNFGNILAGYLAKRSGLPVNKLICASNSNNVLTDFINTGRYDLHRDFINTISPSMDILVSSNLERLLFLLSEDSTMICDLMKKLDTEHFYEVCADVSDKLKDDFAAYWTSETECREMIKELYDNEKILIDPHTAVAYKAFLKYQDDHKDDIPAVILSTASPYKFAADVLDTLGEHEDDPFKAMKKLKDISGMPIPENLRNLNELPVRFTESIETKDGVKIAEERLRKINEHHD